MHSTYLFNTRIIDNETGREVYASSLVQMNGAGFYGFQDTQYTGSNKLVIPEGQLTTLTFSNPIFVKDNQPVVNDVLYPMYDFDTQVVPTYPIFKDSLYRVRLQFVAENVTAAAGQGVRVSAYSPTLGFNVDRNTVALLKGAGDPQRVREVFTFYSDPDTDDGGITFSVTPINGDIRIYNANLLISCNM